MQCTVCTGHHAGPLGICPDCLVAVYPKGISPWVVQNAKKLAPAASPMFAASKL